MTRRATGIVIRHGCALPPAKKAGAFDVAFGTCDWCSVLCPVMHVHGDQRRRANVCLPCLSAGFLKWQKAHSRRKSFASMPPCAQFDP